MADVPDAPDDGAGLPPDQRAGRRPLLRRAGGVLVAAGIAAVVGALAAGLIAIAVQLLAGSS